MSAEIRSALAVLEIDLTAAYSSGDKLTCAKINISSGLDAMDQWGSANSSRYWCQLVSTTSDGIKLILLF